MRPSLGRKIGQCLSMVMIYINFVLLQYRPSGSEEDFKGFAIYSHGDHLGLVILTIYIKFPY